MPEANMRQPLYGAAARRVRDQMREPSDVDVAVSVAQRMLADYAGVDHGDIFALNQAYGAIRESLRILLRALGAAPDGGNFSRSGKAAPRCPATHPDDPTPCDGRPVVTVLDRHNAGADGCEHHGARLLASLEGGRVYALPDAPEGAAIRVFKAAAGIRPFCWYENAPRTRPETLSREEIRRGGEGR